MKKRMGKAAALLMAVTMVCGMLAGCGSNGSEKAPETARRRQKQAQLNQVKPEKAAEQLFMDRMTIQGSIRRWMSMARSMF